MIIERPNLNKADPMANIAMIDTWIARTADALNYEWQQLQKELAALAEEKESTEQTSSEIPVSQALDELYEVAGGPSPTSTTPAMDGTAAVGTETRYARGDHVHPTDTSRAPIASPTFTGTPTAPTAEAGTDTTQLATTAFVQEAIENLALSFRIEGGDLVVDY